MATFKACVIERIKDDKTYGVRIRVTHQRKPLYIPTEHYVTKSQIDKSFNIKDPILAHTLSTTIKNYREKSDKLSTGINDLTCQELINYLVKKDIKKVDFIEFSSRVIAGIKSKGSRDNANITLRSFIDFIGQSIDINEISLITLKKYEAYIRSPRTVTRSNNPGVTYQLSLKGVSDTAVKDYMAKLKNWYTEAMKEYNDRGNILIPYNPFDKYEAPKQVITGDKDLTSLQILSLRDCPTVKVGKYGRSDITQLAQDISMLSFYLLGMNAVDLYHVDSYKNGRISYNRAKTASRRGDNAFISIFVQPEAQPLVEKYRDKTGQRVFNFYQYYTHHDGLTNALNNGLKNIREYLGWGVDATFIWIRYSWSNIARNECRIPVDDVAQAMNHSDESHKTTDIYLKKDWKIIDDANRKVLDHLNRLALKRQKVTKPVT